MVAQNDQKVQLSGKNCTLKNTEEIWRILKVIRVKEEIGRYFHQNWRGVLNLDCFKGH